MNGEMAGIRGLAVVLAAATGLGLVAGTRATAHRTTDAAEEPPHTTMTAAATPNQAAADEWAGIPVVPERPAPDFSLTDQHGNEWLLEDARGKVTLLFFGYTRCPDVCPQTLQRLTRALDLIDGDDDVEVVLVTTDPEHDTPPILAGYLAGFGTGLVGLTGEPSAADAVARLYGAVQDEAPHHDHDGIAVHSARVWAIDAFGQMRVSYAGAFAPADVAHDVSLLLAERR